LQAKYHWHERFERFCERYSYRLDPFVQPSENE